MLLAHTAARIDTLVSLGVVAGILTISIAASLLRPARPLAFAGASATGLPRN